MAIFEIEGPDGQIYEVDAPDEQSAVAAFGQYQPQATTQESNPWDNIDAFGRALANGATFGFADYAGAGARWLGGKVLPWQSNVTYDEALQEVKGQDAALAEQYPVADLAGNVMGGLGTGVAMANRGLTLAGRLGTGQMTGVSGLAARTGLMGAEGSAIGALTAYGNDQDVSEGAKYGLLAGVGGNLLGEGIQAGINRATQRGLVPTIDDLKQQATNLYQQAEARGVVADAIMTNQLADDITKIARDAELITPKGRVSESYPKAKEAMNLMQDYAGEVMNPVQMQVVRESLADARNSTQGKERRIASKMLETFDNFTTPLAPELDEARKVSQRYLKAGQLEKMRELGDVRASQYTNAGTENAMRTEYRQLDRNITKGTEQGWSPAEREAIKAVSRGTPLQNTLRTIGKAAPTGPVSFIGGAGVPYMIGHSVGGPAMGAAAAAGTAGIGYASRAASNIMQQRAIEVAELLARSGGQLPVLNDTATRDAIVRSLIYGATPQLAGE